MNKILFFLLFFCNLYAENILHISKNLEQISSNNYLYFIKEDNNHNSSEKILTSDQLKLVTNPNFGITAGPFWTKITLKNSQEHNNILAYFTQPGLNDIDVFIYKNNQLIKEHTLGDLRSQKQREILSRYSLFPLDLAPNEEVTIISKIENYTIYRLEQIFISYKNYISMENKIDFTYGLIGGYRER